MDEILPEEIKSQTYFGGFKQYFGAWAKQESLFLECTNGEIRIFV